ncbi:SDR family oxidoreductase [candidate division KSB1 bacterium]|nr:SDR family oxidoreductase [candidate division KSB1 bacterium]
MKVLFIGGTGNISSAVSRLAVDRGIDLYLLNRGKRQVDIPKARQIKTDILNPTAARSALGKQMWDVVVNWIAFKEDDINRDLELFRGKTKQYIFISSASAYQKPLSHPVITESTPLANPYWDYSRDKIACEERLNRAYRDEGFPITIVRPSLTYDTVIPVAIGSWDDYTIIDRMKKGGKVIVHGDGSSLWTITHSEDFAKGFVGLLGHQQAIGQAFHITSDEILTWDQIYQAVAEAAGVKANIVHIASDFICDVADTLGQSWMRGNLLGDKAVSAIFDNSKIKRFVPDFTATIPFRTGIKRTVQWFEAKPERMVIHKDNKNFMDKVLAAYERNNVK